MSYATSFPLSPSIAASGAPSTATAAMWGASPWPGFPLRPAQAMTWTARWAERLRVRKPGRPGATAWTVGVPRSLGNLGGGDAPLGNAPYRGLERRLSLGGSRGALGL